MAASSQGFSEAALREADAMIRSNQAHVQSKLEKRIDAVGKLLVRFSSERFTSYFVETVVNNVSSNAYTSIARNELATEAFSYVKDQVSEFTKHSKMLIALMDEVAQLHPFTRGQYSTISPFVNIAS